MKNVTQVHEERETLLVDVNLPGHDARVTTPLFTHTRRELIQREDGRCFVCGRTAAECGHPLEAHHVWIERCLAEIVDWPSFCAMIFGLERLIGYMADYCRRNPAPGDILSVVDDMTINGMLLCKEHHTAPGTGIHTLPFPLWLAQLFGQDGFQFTQGEALIHEAVPTTEQAA